MNSEQKRPDAYEGDDNYVFISYSHENRDLVYKDLNILQSKGLRFWYDEGLVAGNYWDEVVKNKISDPRCRRVIFYVSEEFFLSESLETEVDFVVNVAKKDFFCVNIGAKTIQGLIGPNFNIIPWQRFQLYTNVFQANRLYIVMDVCMDHITEIQEALLDCDVIEKDKKDLFMKRKCVQRALVIGKRSNFTVSLVNGIESYFSSNQDMTLEIRYVFDIVDSEEEILSIIEDSLGRYACYLIRPLKEPSLAFSASLKSLQSKGYNVLLLDLNIPDSDPKSKENPYYVGSDFKNGGLKVGNIINAWVKRWNNRKHTKVLIMFGPEDKCSVRERCNALKDAIENNGLNDITEFYKIHSLNVDKEYKRIESYHKKLYSGLNVNNTNLIVFCGNDTLAEKMISDYIKFKMLKKRDTRFNEVIFIGYDGIKDLTDNYILFKYPCNCYTIDVMPGLQGYKAAELAHNAVFKEPVEKELLVVPAVKDKLMILPKKYKNIRYFSPLLEDADCFIFDLDGTIADTERLHWKAYNVLLKEYGVVLDDRAISKYIGNPEVIIYDMIRDDYGILFDTKDFLTRRLDEYLRLVESENLQPFPYFMEIIKKYPDKRYGLLTSQVPHIIDFLLTKWQLDEIIPQEMRISVHDSTVTKKEVLANPGKYYHIDSQKDRFLLFEDAEHTLQVGMNEGLKCVGIEHLYNINKLFHCDLVISNDEKIGLFVGLCCQDLIYNVDALPEEDNKIKTEKYSTAIGGPAANAAITYSMLGGKAILVTYIGDSAIGKEMKETLREMNITVYDLANEKAQNPNIATIFLGSNGSRTVISGQNNLADGTYSYEGFDIKNLASMSDFCLYDCNLKKIAEPIIRAMVSYDKPIVLDIGNWKDDIHDYLSYGPDVIASSQLIRKFGSLAEFKNNYNKVRNLAVTNGAGPIEVMNEDGSSRINIEQVEELDTLGAGDVLHGAYCFYRYIHGLDFNKALTAASKVATFKVSTYGIVDAVKKFSNLGKLNY